MNTHNAKNIFKDLIDDLIFELEECRNNFDEMSNEAETLYINSKEDNILSYIFAYEESFALFKTLINRFSSDTNYYKNKFKMLVNTFKREIEKLKGENMNQENSCEDDALQALAYQNELLEREFMAKLKGIIPVKDSTDLETPRSELFESAYKINFSHMENQK